MGGRGSGGHNRLSDEEKKRRGTFRNNTSEAVQEERAAAKVLQGPWLSEIPEPDYPLNDVGRKKYDEWTRELFEQGKLTKIAVTRASALALLHQKFHNRAEAGKEISANDLAKFQSGLRELNIAQNAKVTAAPGKSRFADCGFSNQRTSPIRLLRPEAPGPAKRGKRRAK